MFQLFWLNDRLTLYWQTDYPSATTTKRYVSTDESGRPIEMNDWASTGGAWSRVWAIDPSAWGSDTNKVGPTVFQPLMFAGQYQDVETAAFQNDGATMHRAGTSLNGFRTYDTLTGSYLQVDPLVDSTWSTYVYVQGNPVGRRDSDGRMSGLLLCMAVDRLGVEVEVDLALFQLGLLVRRVSPVVATVAVAVAVAVAAAATMRPASKRPIPQSVVNSQRSTL